jgi:hypothetical protein
MLFDSANPTLTTAGVNLVDRIGMPTKRQINDQGQMIVPCTFARTGTQLYSAGQLGLQDRAPNEIVEVHREEADVFDDQSMQTFRSAPVTIGHPINDKGEQVAVTAKNSKELQVGMLEGMPVRDEDGLGGTLVLTAQNAIDTVEEGTVELSAGYTCDLEEVDGKIYQRNIKANHIAIVARGRAGPSCRISDEALAIQEEAKKAELTDAVAKAEEAEKLVASLTDELSVQKELVVTLKQTADDQEVALEAVKAQLADAQLAATQGVIERCEAIEHARLIADMRDLGDKSVEEIKKLVVTDQYPEKDFSEKSDAFIEAMFELLVDQAKGETPMSKLLRDQETHVAVTTPKVSVADAARQKMIQTQMNLSKS